MCLEAAASRSTAMTPSPISSTEVRAKVERISRSSTAGARWLFASEANQKRFEEDPQRFLPAYGGYCAYGVSQGYLVKIDPEAWKIVNDRLYLNYDRSVARTWAKDIAGYVKTADRNWPKLVSKP